MKIKLFLVILGVIILAAGIYVRFSDRLALPDSMTDLLDKVQSSEKMEAIKTIQGYADQAQYHKARLLEIGKMLVTATNNLDVITDAAKYVSTTGSNTDVYMKIARIASETGFEAPEFKKLLDLAVRSTSEPGRIITLAEDLSRSKTQEERDKINQAIDALQEKIK